MLNGKVNVDRVWKELEEPLYNDSFYKLQEDFTVILPGINSFLRPTKHRNASMLRTELYGMRSDFARYSRSGQNYHGIDRLKAIIVSDKVKCRTLRGVDMRAIGKSVWIFMLI